MTAHAILTWPDPRLSHLCDPVTDLAALHDLAADMFDTMYTAQGRGLAALQVGVMQRVFVMDVTWKEGVKSPVTMVNPVIEWASDQVATGSEGCLSIPGITADVTRPTQVRMRWSDLAGDTHIEVLTGFAAICAQHELDHLNGIVTFDRVSPDMRAVLEQEYAR